MNTRFAILAGVAVAMLVGCGGKAETGGDDKGPIKIGHYASLTGKEATFGQQVEDGLRLALDEINAAGGVLGRKIEVITEDTQSETQPTINAVEKLVGRDEVIALIGEVASGRTMAAVPVAQREKIPLLSPASTNPKATVEKGKVLEYAFRICFIDPFQGEVMAKFANENLGAKKVAVLVDRANPYSVGLAENFTETFKAIGGQVLVQQEYRGGESDFRAQLTAIKATNPEAIFVPGYYNEVSLIAQQARQLGIAVPLLGGDGWDSPVLTQGASGAALEGCYFSNHYSEQDTSAAVQDFIKRFQGRFNEVPGAMAALGYDAMKIVAHVIQQAGKADPESIRAGLEQLRNYNGVTGAISIDANHNATKPAVVLKITGGKPTYVATVYPSGAAPAAGS